MSARFTVPAIRSNVAPALAKVVRKSHESTRRAGRRLGIAVGRDAGAAHPCLSRSRHQARRAVLARRRHRCRRPAVGGEDEAAPRHRGDGEPRRRRRRDRRRRGRARAAGRAYLPVRQYQHAGAHSRDHAQPALRSAQGFRRDLYSLQRADLDRGPRIRARAHPRTSSSPTPGPIRASCPTARPAPAR